MVKKTPSQEDDQPIDYFKEERAAQSQRTVPYINVVKKLRGETLPSTEALPRRENFLHRIDLKVALGILLAFLVVGVLASSAFGVGKQRLEQSLFDLYGITRTPTLMISKTSTQSLLSLPIATFTPTSKPSLTPSKTPVLAGISSSTPIPPSATSVIAIVPTESPKSSPASACVDVGTITLSDVGKSLCVQGIVKELVDAQSGFMVVFNNEKGAFYWVTYDLVWSAGEVDHCYQVNGEIDQIASSPVLVFNYRNLPIECPE